MNLRSFDDAEAAATALAAELLRVLDAAIARHGRASLAVPGGRTPVPLFERLASAPIAWSQVFVTLTDERWVPESDAGSNAALVRRSLLSGPASAAHFIPLRNEAATAAEGAPSATAALPLPFDAMVLGMGEDGHFASLFPGNPGLDEALDMRAEPVCVPMCAPVEPSERLSLNLAAIARSGRLFLLVSGTEKRELLLATRGPEQRLPVDALLALGERRVEIYWSA